MCSFCKCKSYSHFFSKNISIYAIFNDQSFFKYALTNNIISFEQLGPGRFPATLYKASGSMLFAQAYLSKYLEQKW